MSSRITGLIAAPFTPFHPDGQLNLRMIERQAAHLIASGVCGAFICGTTGESASLTIAERKLIAQRWVEVAGSELAIIVHTGHNCLADSRELAAHAQQIGAHATAAVAPCYFKPARMPELVACCQQMASAAPKIPFFYYHIPSMTGLHFSMAHFLTCAREQIPNLAGVKFTHEDLMDYAQATQVAGGAYNILFGRDEILLSALALGARGAVGSTYNYLAPIYRRLMAAFAAGDLETAQHAQTQAVRFIDLMLSHGGLPAAKAMMQMVGIDCGPVRLPLRSLSREQVDRLRKELEEAGFFAAIVAGCTTGSATSTSDAHNGRQERTAGITPEPVGKQDH